MSVFSIDDFNVAAQDDNEPEFQLEQVLPITSAIVDMINLLISNSKISIPSVRLSLDSNRGSTIANLAVVDFITNDDSHLVIKRIESYLPNTIYTNITDNIDRQLASNIMQHLVEEVARSVKSPTFNDLTYNMEAQRILDIFRQENEAAQSKKENPQTDEPPTDLINIVDNIEDYEDSTNV